MKTIPKLLVHGALVFLILSRGPAQTHNAPPQPRGRLVDVGGYRVHVYCAGDGSPTVLITGAGYSFDWGLVQPEVAKFTRVCAYDHSGIAWSDPGPTDTCSLRVREIHSAMRNAQIPGPYVLVGHSLDALVSRLYTSKYSDDVAGMVIVDHALQFSGPHLIPASPRVSRPPNPSETIGTPNVEPLPAALPVPVAPRAVADLSFQKLSPRHYQLHLWANSLPGYSRVMDRNRAMVSECASEVEAESRNQTSPLKDKPLIVLSTSARYSLHSTFLSLSLNSKLVVAENSGHAIMIDRPDVVVDAIREVVEAAQNYSKLKN